MKRRTSDRFKRQKKSSNSSAIIFLGISILIAVGVFLGSNENKKSSNQQTEVFEEANIHFNRGNERLSMGDCKGAIDSYTEAILLYPQFVWALANRGVALARIADTHEIFQKAMRDLDTALQLDPKNSQIYFYRGNVKNDSADYNGAIKDYNEAIRLNPQYEVAYVNRGLAYYHKGNEKNFDSLKVVTKEAEADWKTFLQLTKNNPEYQDRSNWILERFKETKIK